jgi:[protein-PII] uridylyltransferase
LKESLGGERDRQLVWWIAGALGPFDAEGRLIEVEDGIHGWPLSRAVSRARRGAGSRPPQSVADVRLSLHGVNGATSNRLLSEHHDPVARVLRMMDQPGWDARDLLMRWVASAGREIDRSAERLLDRIRAPLEDYHLPSIRPGDAAAAFVHATPPEPDTGWSPLFLEAFLALLKEGRLIEGAFGEARASLLQSLPEWGAVMGRPQRDPYHRYPVDVHLMETVKEAGNLLSDPEEPFAGQAAAAVHDSEALLLGALLHDIGKVGTGSHVPVGVDVAARALVRMGVQGARREDVLFLVADHLLLSDSATRRNIEDEDLVLRVASRIRTPERLGMLYLLTVADAKATGPSACTPWRMNLIRDLVSKVSLVLERGQVDSGRVHRLEAGEASIRRALADRSPQDVETFLQSVPTAYLLSVRPGEAAIHLDLMKDRPRPDEVRMDIREGPAPGAWVVTVVALDRVGLLADVAGALSVSGLSILAARAFTSERGIALDEFEVRGAFEPEPGADRWARFRATLEGAVKGEDLELKLRSVRSHYRRSTASIPVRVRIDQEGSNFYTVVEVEGSDRIGLLSDLARAFARLGVDVHTAKVATYGPRVVDVFYVTDGAGEKLKEAPQVEALERELREAASAL